MNIRPVCMDDLDAFIELRLAALQAHPEAFLSDYDAEHNQPRSFWQERLQKNVEGEESCLFLAVEESSGELVGSAGVFLGYSPKNRHQAMVWGVFVSPHARGLGLGKQLMNSCLDWARGKGARLVKLGVTANNTAAIQLYSDLGFTVYGIEPEAIFQGERFWDELLMVRRLNSPLPNS